MASIYNPTKTTATSRNFQSMFNIDPNAFVSAYLKTNIDEVRRLYNEYPIPHAVIDTLTRYVVGTGLIPRSAPERSYLNWSEEECHQFMTDAEAFFRMITGDQSFDYYGKDNFRALQQEAFKTILITGDVLLHRSYSDKARRYKPFIQLIAGDWVRNPDFTDLKKRTGGVIFDNNGCEIGYEIAVTDDNRIDTYSSKVVDKFNKRTGFKEFELIKLQGQQSGLIRGIPILNPVKEQILLVSAFDRAYVTKALVSSIMTVFIESTEEVPEGTSGLDAARELAAQTSTLGEEIEEKGVYELGAGVVARLAPGEKASIAESKLAGTDYKTFIDANLDIIGAGSAGVPREILLQSFNSSYSASKGTLASAEKGFRIYREDFEAKFATPIWEQVIDYGIRIGELRMPNGYLTNPMVKKATLACSWIGPTPVALDPVKEVQAMSLSVNNRFMTMEQAIQQLYGNDFDETQDRIDREKGRLGGGEIEGNE